VAPVPKQIDLLSRFGTNSSTNPTMKVSDVLCSPRSFEGHHIIRIPV